MSDLDRVFSAADREAVRQATADAEAKTGAEVVSVVVARCDAYAGAVWKAALLGALAASLAVAAWLLAAGPWRAPGALAVALPPFAGAALGWLVATLWPALARLLVLPEVMDLRVDRRAAQAFVEEGIGATRAATGVLLFVALFEHRVRVVADRGVEGKVAEDVWLPIADDLALGMRQGRGGAALVAAIERCGELLAAVGVERAEDDENELSDDLRLRDA